MSSASNESRLGACSWAIPGTPLGENIHLGTKDCDEPDLRYSFHSHSALLGSFRFRRSDQMFLVRWPAEKTWGISGGATGPIYLGIIHKHNRGARPNTHDEDYVLGIGLILFWVWIVRVSFEHSRIISVGMNQSQLYPNNWFLYHMQQYR